MNPAKDIVRIKFPSTALALLVLLAGFTTPQRANALDLVSMNTLIAVQCSLNEARAVDLVHYMRPGWSQNRVRIAYIALHAAIIPITNLAVTTYFPQYKFDLEKTAWSTGEFLLVYFATSLYFNQPLMPNQMI